MHDDPTASLDELDDIAKQVNKWRERGQVLVHCQAGLNRSSLVVVRALMLAPGMSAKEAIALLREKRSTACLCNKGFEDYLLSL
jgi:protein-tyrosine phosphatase